MHNEGRKVSVGRKDGISYGDISFHFAWRGGGKQTSLLAGCDCQIRLRLDRLVHVYVQYCMWDCRYVHVLGERRWRNDMYYLRTCFGQRQTCPRMVQKWHAVVRGGGNVNKYVYSTVLWRIGPLVQSNVESINTWFREGGMVLGADALGARA